MRSLDQIGFHNSIAFTIGIMSKDPIDLNEVHGAGTADFRLFPSVYLFIHHVLNIGHALISGDLDLVDIIGPAQGRGQV